MGRIRLMSVLSSDFLYYVIYIDSLDNNQGDQEIQKLRREYQGKESGQSLNMYKMIIRRSKPICEGSKALLL